MTSAAALNASVAAGVGGLVLATALLFGVGVVVAVLLALVLGWRPGEDDYPHEHGDGGGQ